MASTSSFSSASCPPAEKPVKARKSTAGDKLQYPTIKLNYSVDPCDDLYHHVCSRWIAENPVPSDRTAYNKLTVAADLIKPGLYNDTKPSSSKAINDIKQYFQTCNDLDALNAAGTGKYLAGDRSWFFPSLFPLLHRFLQEFGGWPLLAGDSWNASDFDLTALVDSNRKTALLQGFCWTLTRARTSATSRAGSSTSTSGSRIMPSREYYLKDVYKPKLQAYREYMSDVLWLLTKDAGANRTLCDIQKVVDELVEIDVKLAGWSKAKEERYDYDRVYNLRNLSELNELAPAINWTRYMREISPPEVHEYLDADPQVVVNEIEYIENVSKLLQETEPRILANYVFWRYTHVFVAALDNRFHALEDEFNRKLVGKEKRALRWRECLTFTIEFLPALSGAVFVRDKFSKEAKQVATNLFEELRTAFIRKLNGSEWISDEAEEMIMVVGAPDFVFDDQKLDDFYADLDFSKNDSFFVLEQKVQRFEQRRTLRHLLKPPGRDTMEISAAMVNAYNAQTNNKIIAPAAILQEPFFHPKYPKSAIYAAIGQVLGHEMGHSFDGQGRQFDTVGNLFNWWDNRTLSIFNKRTKCITEQYSSYAIKEDPSVHVNGALTRDENVADNVGLRQAYHAYHQYLDKHGKHEAAWPGFKNYTDDQMFFLSFANLLCTSMTKDQAVQAAIADSHAPSNWRVNGGVANMPQFARAFNCSAKAPLNPPTKCKIWRGGDQGAGT
ncbi:Neprilysin-1 [Aphelenchoides fujianensis]|nr:Neprilysin-1 [Aphelenchoides fujianensis]